MFIKIVTLYFVFFFSTFAHELGHIMMAKIFYNAKNCRIEIGIGKNILKLKKFIVRVLPAYGLAYWEFKDWDSYRKSSKLRKIMPSLGGPLVSLLIALGFILISRNNYSGFYSKIIRYVILYNAICFVSTILPIKYLNLPSDGMRILNTIKSTEDNVN
ncbi:MAG: site-2 protease family protein [Finegoldia magna]|nr:site-2 protease family protein [Finegoldia magna]